MAEKEKMPAKLSAEQKREERRKRAMLGPLPENFLRIPVDEEPLTDEERDREMALALQKQLNYQERATQPQMLDKNVTGRLTITIAEAKLTKNYGVTRMDPYARIRVGHQIYETPTCTNGAREPKWNKTINCFTVRGTKYIDVEIYDECTFSTDALVAYASIPIPQTVLEANELSDDWWPLSGQEGEAKEGMIHLILSLQPLPQGMPVVPPAQLPHVVPSLTGGKPMTYTPTVLPTQQKPVEPPVMSDEDLEEFSKMFPAVEKDVIKAIYSENMGNKESTVNTLLQLGQ